MITSGTRKTAAEIIALIKETAIAKAASQQNGFSPVMQQLVEADRASIKDKRGNSASDAFFVDAGAHPLSIRSREKLLNTCAPSGADDASSEVGFSANQFGVKRHAASATTASEDTATSLCSSAEQEQVVNGCADDTPDQHDDTTHEHFDFYEIKTDLFDNSNKGKKSTVHRAKLMIRSEPTTFAKDADVFMLDFYNRSRDINKRLAEMEVENDEWYLKFKLEFSRYSKLLVQYGIAPKLAILKEINKDDKSADIIAYAAGIMFQIVNQPPTLILFFGASRYELPLDFEFNRTPGSPIYKKGIYRDAARQHLDVELSAPKKRFKIKTMADFSK
ncbi:hypothetical protein [Agrobacterium rosae]|uniref:hypothetical protein n=1 Tax=Agrobacterium rosae TaxID=1972867 RepID=UPI000CD9AEFF|nr:hypothetical protein [Agrobacterium rosae]POO56280.1 hypothetical protein CTT39_05970 [Agrobacterium rosae]